MGRPLHLLLHSNVWIALGAPALLGVTSIEAGIPFSGSFAAFSFFAVLLSYNLQRWVRWREGPVHLSRNGYALLALLGATGSASFLFFLDAALLLPLIPVALISLLYAWPLPGGKKGLRDLPHLKLLLIAFSWTYLSVYLPLFLEGKSFEASEWGLFAERFLFFLAITIPFDVRDLPFDDAGKRTMPQVLGVKGAKAAAFLALLLFWGVMGWRTLLIGESAPLSFSAFTLSGVLAGFSIGNSSPERKDYYYSGLLDGTIHLQFLLLALARMLG